LIASVLQPLLQLSSRGLFGRRLLFQFYSCLLLSHIPHAFRKTTQSPPEKWTLLISSSNVRFLCRLSRPVARTGTRYKPKKADVMENPEVSNHVGLLVNSPPDLDLIQTGPVAFYLVIRFVERGGLQ
jgi:hypothetical protein